MSLKTILFDLDGTLLPMDQDAFIKRYFTELAAKMVPYGFETDAFLHTMWNGVNSMMNNDGSRLNEAVFAEAFLESCGREATVYADVLESFYRTEFERAKVHTAYTPKAAELVKDLRDKGHRLVLATSPVYPRVAVEARMRWAGVSPDDFAYITTYENSCFCKPNPAYYTEILRKLGVSPADCVMVGNDTKDDLPAEQVGIQVVLMTDCLINRGGVDMTPYVHGNFDAVGRYLRGL